MGASQQIDKNNPLFVAWTAYKQTEEYANAVRWAGENPEGELWSAFMHGWDARPAPETETPEAEVCEWTQVGYGEWNTACKHWRGSTDGTFNETDCPYCHHPITIKSGRE